MSIAEERAKLQRAVEILGEGIAVAAATEAAADEAGSIASEVIGGDYTNVVLVEATGTIVEGSISATEAKAKLAIAQSKLEEYIGTM